MDQVNVTAVESGVTAVADVLQRSDRHMKVAIVATNITVTLSKNTPNDDLYTGREYGMDFTCDGEVL